MKTKIYVDTEKEMYVSPGPGSGKKKKYKHLLIELIPGNNADKEIIKMIPNINMSVGKLEFLVNATTPGDNDSGKTIYLRCLTEEQIKEDSARNVKMIKDGEKITGF